MLDIIDQGHMQQFAQDLKAAIDKYKDLSEETQVERQKRQFEQLIELENNFRASLIQHRWGPEVFSDFVRHICEERRNILAARPFYRERHWVFTEHISKALQERNPQVLYRYHFNYRWVGWALRARDWSPRTNVYKYAQELKAIRTQLCEMNMPLAVARARIFYSHTPRSHLSYMDLLQTCAEGLLDGIDKYVPPYSQAFRHTVIGRMIGNLIEEYSETPIHFFPRDRRILYRANKILKKMDRDNIDFSRLAQLINEVMDEEHQTNADEVQKLVAASSMLSAESHIPTEDVEEVQGVERFAAPESSRPDVYAENYDAYTQMGLAITKLNPLHRKILRMRGVALGVVSD